MLRFHSMNALAALAALAMIRSLPQGREGADHVPVQRRRPAAHDRGRTDRPGRERRHRVRDADATPQAG